ncbi:G-type lectin S-receptor-like serine/threonine-protein kinase At2g19130 [Cryptomeria japonica]|uniref:G-type lectin S-receptor-like serine/threonine-protein kinase At2g19130 n=1 Tax=Cryptomeria japonica TaxID=3369 RepID=UPI0027DAA89C|nr:G-type lectin S-receptor-like serine/threonine-protein kinase At2g19130 [Cryptomeria japonica]
MAVSVTVRAPRLVSIHLQDPAKAGALTFALGICSILIWWRRQLRSMDKPTDFSDPFLTMFSYKELKIATRNFRSKLGRGGFGSVFKGSLQDGTLVAVKKMEEGSQRLLVYDYMPNGSLNSFLFTSPSKSKRKVLEWKIRFEIANLSPKLADFGLAKLVGRDFSRVLTTTRGTRGYLAPEWIFGLPISSKVDVYSFGMTLLEIISGQTNVNLNVQASSNFYFPSWAATPIQQGSTMNIVEEGVAAEANVEEVRRACVVALVFIQEDEEVRPSMGQVVQMLEGKIEPQTPQISSSTFRPEHPSDTSSYSQGNVTSKKNVNGSMHSKMQRHVI